MSQTLILPLPALVAMTALAGAATGVLLPRLVGRFHAYAEPDLPPDSPAVIAPPAPAPAGVYALITAATFAAVSAPTLSLDWALTPLALLLAWVAVALVAIDMRVMRLPDSIVLGSYAPVLALLALAGTLSGEWPTHRAALSLLLWMAFLGGPWLLTLGRGMGLGDVKLAPVLGLSLGWLGWGESIVGLAAAFVLAAVVSLGVALAGRGIRNRAIPFGPFLLTGALAGLWFGAPLWDAYLTFVGLST